MLAAGCVECVTTRGLGEGGDLDEILMVQSRLEGSFLGGDVLVQVAEGASGIADALSE